MAPTAATHGDGSIGKPWATFRGWIGNVSAKPAPKPGDTLYLRGGTYSGHTVTYVGRHDSGVDTNDAYGTAAAPITIRNYPGEVPVFSGGTQVLLSLNKAKYVVVDGLQIINRPGQQAGWIVTGQWPSAGPWGPADNITIRNCRFTMGPGQGDNGYHPIYATAGTHNLIVEDNVFIGPGNLTPGDGGFGCQVYEGSREAPTGSVIRRNVFDGWNQGGVTIWGSGLTGSVLHNTFLNCVVNIRLGSGHGAVTVRDNAGENGSGSNINDSVPATTTADHNFWGQSFDAAYKLVPGSTGINAASTGDDAGAIDSGTPAQPTGTRVTSVAALLTALADNAVTDIVVANGTYRVSIAAAQRGELAVDRCPVRGPDQRRSPSAPRRRAA